MPQAIIGLIAAIGIPGLVTSAGALTAIGTIVSGAIGLGLSLGASLVLQLLNKPKSPKPAEIKSVVRQSTPPRTRHYGRRRLGGALAFFEADGYGLIQILYLGEGPIAGIDEWYLDDRRAVREPTLGRLSGFGGQAPIFAQIRLGMIDQTAFTSTISRFGTIWTPAHRGLGCAAIELDSRNVSQEAFSNNYPNKYPVLNTVGRWAVIRDPRDPAQIEGNVSTYQWSANLALILRDYLTHRDGMQIPLAFVDEASFVIAANEADALLPTKTGGSVRRYHGALTYSLTDDPADILKRLIQATDGRLALRPSDGRIVFSVGVWREPTVTIEDRHIIACELRDRSDALRESNEVIVKYENPASRYGEVTCDPWRDEEDIAASGQIKSNTLEAYEVQSHHHARRLAKLAARRASSRWQGTIRTNLYGMLAMDERFIRLQLSELDIDTTFEVTSWSLDDATMTVSMQILAMDAEAWSFDAATEEGTEPVAPIDAAAGDMPPPVNVTAIAGRKSISGGVTISTIAMTWALPAGVSGAKPEVEYAEADSENWVPIAVTSSATSAETPALTDAALYDVRVRLVGSGGTPSAWVMIENVLATADPVAPAAPTAGTVVAGPAAGGFTVTWTNPASGNFRATRVYRATTNNPAGATLLATVYGAASGPGRYETAALTGTSYFWVAAINSSGTESARVAVTA